jgi:hypothetical protein
VSLDELLRQSTTDWMEAKTELMKFFGLKPADFFDICVEEFFELIRRMRKMVAKADEKSAARDWIEDRMKQSASLMKREEDKVY